MYLQFNLAKEPNKNSDISLLVLFGFYG